uniref:MTM0097 n=1 Tax=Volvox carteri f. nagariensis TaxID=3068 RepID=D9CJ46_VOLCA|nr:MTM0097 [Volvox carteri f. nagariensis]
MTEEERQHEREANAVREQQRRAEMTEEERQHECEANAAREQQRRAEMTEEERQHEREANAAREQQRRAEMTEEERQHECEANAAREQQRRAEMTEEERQHEREANVAREQQRRAEMTEEERQHEREANMAREQQRRTEMTEEEWQRDIANRVMCRTRARASGGRDAEELQAKWEESPNGMCESCHRGFYPNALTNCGLPVLIITLHRLLTAAQHQAVGAYHQHTIDEHCEGERQGGLADNVDPNREIEEGGDGAGEGGRSHDADFTTGQAGPAANGPAPDGHNNDVAVGDQALQRDRGRRRSTRLQGRRAVGAGEAAAPTGLGNGLRGPDGRDGFARRGGDGRRGRGTERGRAGRRPAGVVVPDIAAYMYTHRHELPQHYRVCTTCRSYLKDGEMPPQCVANRLMLRDLPEQLRGLRDGEWRLVCRAFAYHQLYVLPRGQQTAARGIAITVRSNTEEVTSLLPRAVNNAGIALVRTDGALPNQQQPNVQEAPQDNGGPVAGAGPPAAGAALRRRAPVAFQVRVPVLASAPVWLVRNNPLYKGPRPFPGFLEADTQSCP